MPFLGKSNTISRQFTVDLLLNKTPGTMNALPRRINAAGQRGKPSSFSSSTLNQLVAMLHSQCSTVKFMLQEAFLPKPKGMFHF